MRRFRAGTAYFFLLILILGGLAGCGGGGAAAVGPITAITLSPNPAVSLTAGDVMQMTVAATDAKGATVLNQPFTFGSSNPAIQIASNGLLCGGTWDSLASPVVCTAAPVTAAGSTANITATAQSVTSNAVLASVHLQVTGMTLVPSTAACVSQNVPISYTPLAVNNGTDITASLGTINWTVSAAQVGTLAAVTSTGNAPMAVTARLPGQMLVTASVNNVNQVNSLPATFTECPVASIVISPGAAPTPFNFSAVNGTQQLSATVTDSANQAVTGETLTWNARQPAIVSITNAGLATGLAPGTGNVIASCTPNACNFNLNQPVYSNVATGVVPGSSSTTVFAASSSGTSLLPIAATGTTNAAGTAITLPQTPNSLMFAPAGTRAFLGSTGGLMVVDATAAAPSVTNLITNAPGTVLAVSPDNNQVVVSNPATSAVFDYNVSGNSVTTLSIANASAADFTPDGFRVFILGGTPAGSTVYVAQSSAGTISIPLPAAATDLKILASGEFAYLAELNTPRISTCANSLVTAPAAPGGAPVLVKSLPDGSQMLGAESGKIDAITVTSIPATASGSGCPSLTDTLAQHAFASAFTPRQLIVTPDSKHAYITSNLTGTLPSYDVASGTAGSIALSGAPASTTLSGGATADSAFVYVGASDQNVHVINVSTGTEATPISVGFTPDLVAVRPH
jgi:hypothetical protein